MDSGKTARCSADDIVSFVRLAALSFGVYFGTGSISRHKSSIAIFARRHSLTKLSGSEGQVWTSLYNKKLLNKHLRCSVCTTSCGKGNLYKTPDGSFGISVPIIAHPTVFSFLKKIPLNSEAFQDYRCLSCLSLSFRPFLAHSRLNSLPAFNVICGGKSGETHFHSSQQTRFFQPLCKIWKFSKLFGCYGVWGVCLE